MNINWPVPGLFVFLISIPITAAAQATPSITLQDRQFIYSVSTLPSDVRHATVNVEAGFGSGPFDITDADRPEQRFGVQADLGHRLSLLARVGVSSDERDVSSSQQGELLFRVLQAPAKQASVAVGLGMRHESMGANVLLGRVAAGRSFDDWRIDGNALFEKPYSVDRDAVDLITTFGVSRRLWPAFSAGVELIGEDLEGFWEPNEAEGGARLLIGPSIRIAPPTKRWQVAVAGGPLLHATHSGRSSDALRGLPSSMSDSSYAVRASMSYGF
jgi:hypothetical protein